MSEKHFISRRDAEVKLRLTERARLSSLSKEQLVALLVERWEPRWYRLRNYEIEDMLRAAFVDGYPADVEDPEWDEWIVSEFCPFNGKYCSWGDFVEEHEDKVAAELLEGLEKA